MLAVVLMLLFLSSAVMVCDGNSGNRTSPTAPSDPGTTLGNRWWITGTAGATTATGTINLLVD